MNVNEINRKFVGITKRPRVFGKGPGGRHFLSEWFLFAGWKTNMIKLFWNFLLLARGSWRHRLQRCQVLNLGCFSCRLFLFPGHGFILWRRSSWVTRFDDLFDLSNYPITKPVCNISKKLESSRQLWAPQRKNRFSETSRFVFSFKTRFRSLSKHSYILGLCCWQREI